MQEQRAQSQRIITGSETVRIAHPVATTSSVPLNEDIHSSVPSGKRSLTTSPSIRTDKIFIRMNVDGMSPCLMLAFVSLLLSTTAAWNAFPSFAVRTVPNTMAGRSLDSSAARSSSTLSTPPTLSPLTVDEEEQASPYQVAPLWPSHSNGYAHKSNDTVAVIQTSSLSTIPTPETLVSVVGDSALAMESDEQSMELLTLELQAQAATDASSFEATKFHPWITNCHVQTIGGFVLRDTPAAFLPKHNPLGSVRRIWQGIQSKVQKPADDNGPACSRSDFWDVRQTIPTKDGDWFHADTKYAIGTASAGGQKKMKQTPFFLSETLPTINHKNDNHDDHHPLIDVSTMEHLSSSSSTDRRPTHVVLIHGLESNSNSSLSKQIAQACHEQDMTVTCLNFRSCSMDGQGKTLPNELLGGCKFRFLLTYRRSEYVERTLGRTSLDCIAVVCKLLSEFSHQKYFLCSFCF